eukprot:6493161-Ditylum_brightwellii.AAC.1
MGGDTLFYVVVLGWKGGIYLGWDDTKQAIRGALECQHKSHSMWENALQYYKRYHDGRAARFRADETPDWVVKRVYPLPLGEDASSEDEERSYWHRP